MTQYEYDIAYNEGFESFKYEIRYSENPYYGVSDALAEHFDYGYLDAWNQWYERIKK